MDILLLRQAEQIQQEIYLHQRLSARYSDAAALIETDITLILFDDIGRLHQRAAVHFPGVGIMAVGTAHGTALYKHDEPDARPVYGTETF